MFHFLIGGVVFVSPAVSICVAQAPPLEERVRGLMEKTKSGTDLERENATRELRLLLKEQGFGKVPLGDVVTHLSELAKDSNYSIRHAALFGLAALHDEAAVPKLIEALDDRGTWREACVCLRDIGPKGKSAIPALVAGVKAGKLTGVVFEALVALAEKDAPKLIVDAVSQQKGLEPRARIYAANALAEQADPKSASFVAQVMGEGTPSLQAARFLAKVGTDESLAGLRKALQLKTDKPIGDYLHRTDVSIEADIRQVAVEALGKAKDKDAIEAILKILANDTGIRVQTAAAAALGEYADNRAVPALVKALSQPDVGFIYSGHNDGTLRRTAVRSLGRIGSEDALAALYEGAREGPARSQCVEFWVNSKDKTHLAAFLKLHDAKPLDANLAAGIIHSLLRAEKEKKLTAEEQAKAEAEFLKAVNDPKRFGPDVDLSEKGKYTVKTTFSFHRDDFATVSFGFSPVPKGYSHGYGLLYRKTEKEWKLVGGVFNWVE